jgi:hypothetical protein
MTCEDIHLIKGCYAVTQLETYAHVRDPHSSAACDRPVPGAVLVDLAELEAR